MPEDEKKLSTVDKLAKIPPPNPQTTLPNPHGKTESSAKKDTLPNQKSFVIMAKIPFDRITIPADVRKALEPFETEQFIVIIQRKYARGSEIQYEDK